jgi:succinate dehydrogenase hydrophobic anchor subunit
MTSFSVIFFKIPYVSRYAKTRGWAFILCWCHRITGLLLVLYVWFHIATLSALSVPETYNAKMALFSSPLIVFLEWLLAIPVIFHAVNGGRLMLFESYGYRDDHAMIRWLFVASAAYVFLLAVLMLLGNQIVSSIFYWLSASIVAVTIGYTFWVRTRHLGHSPYWKFQRISGAFLLVMIPAHFLFMHLNPSMAKDSTVIIARMQNSFVKIVDFSIILTVLYHGAYGLYSIGKDYIVSRPLQISIIALIVFVMALFAWTGIKIIFIT